MGRFAGRRALVTGAASGIGRATTERLAAEGARLLCCDTQAEPLERLVKELAEGGVEAEARVCDVSDPEAVRATVEAGTAHLGGLDVLCNVAGILLFSHTHELSLADWNRILAVNLTGTFLMCREAIPHLLESRGNIVNVSSTAALRAHPWTAAYTAAKAGVLAFTHGLAVEYGRQGLRANVVCPGSIATPIQKAFHVPKGADPKLVRRMLPLTGGAQPPETVATAIAFLASDEAAHINGTTLRVDGAMCT
ncbi:MAG: SDR family NAD(P)-dependent oxidoreductase [Myxococcota bacterium]